MDKMIEKKIGFIGCGHMASAIIEGLVESGACSVDNIMASAAHEKNVFGVSCGTDNVAVASKSEILVLAVRPLDFEKVALEIKDAVRDDTVVVSVAAFITLKDMREMFGRDLQYVRCMPNGPVSVGQGMSAVCGDVNDDVLAIFRACGKCEIVDEALLDAVIAVSGSSPAYVYMLINAMANKAVELGMSEEFALEFAAQATLGSAQVVQSLDITPDELIKEICTPNGTTIEAVEALRDHGFEEAVKDAMQAAFDKSKDHE